MTRPHATGWIALAGALALSAWLVAEHRRNPGPEVGAGLPSTAIVSAAGTRMAPVVLDAAQLAERARTLGAPVYWVGPRFGRGYELSRDEQSRVYIRYLPAGAAAGDMREALSVATIPFAGAYATTKQLANGPSAVSVALPGGAVAWYNRARPGTVYLARPGLESVIQVTSPTAGEARRLVFGGSVREVV